MSLSLVNLSLNLHYLLGSKVISQLERYFVSQGQYRTIIGMFVLFNFFTFNVSIHDSA